MVFSYDGGGGGKHSERLLSTSLRNRTLREGQ